MLVLSRKEGEGLVTSNGVRIVVTYVRGNRVGIGIKAPPDVNVLREELMPPGYDPNRLDPKMVSDTARNKLVDNREIKT